MKLCFITSTHEQVDTYDLPPPHLGEGSPARSARAPRLAIAASPPPPPPSRRGMSHAPGGQRPGQPLERLPRHPLTPA